MDLLFTNPLRSPLTTYNTIMKILFISSTLYIVHQMRTRYVHTYNATADAFRVPFLVGPAAVAALLFHLKNTVVEVLWAFSIFLEAVAIMPQLFLLQKTGEVENITSHYIAALGAYRALYAVNWVWRAFWEPGYRQWLAWTAGVVQTVLYADFFYHYIKRYVWNLGAEGGGESRGLLRKGGTAGRVREAVGLERRAGWVRVVAMSLSLEALEPATVLVVQLDAGGALQPLCCLLGCFVALGHRCDRLRHFFCRRLFVAHPLDTGS